MSIKPLFIGLGNQAIHYAKAFRFLDIDIHSACVKNLEKHKYNFVHFKVKNRYTNINDALKDGKFNSVFVFLPWNIIEKEIANIIKKTNKTIYTEKPVALSYKKLLYLDKISKKHNNKVYILLNRRFYNIFNIIKKNIVRKKLFNFDIIIPEKINRTLKKIDKKLKGKIKYHLTIHWLDFFYSVLNIKPKKFILKKNFASCNFGAKKNIKIIYNGHGKILANINFKNRQLKLSSLENLTIYKSGSKINKYNEFKYNKIKPGVLNLVRHILKKNKNFHNLPKIENIKKLYKSISYLPY